MSTALAESTDPETHPEQRRGQRRRVMKGAKIAYGDFVFVRDCSLRDVSATGARISSVAAHEIPEEFYLIFLADRLMRNARVVWRGKNELGVEFDGEPRSLMADGDPRLRQFKFR
jgi:hypothetical protein